MRGSLAFAAGLYLRAHPRLAAVEPERIARTTVYRVACWVARGVRNA